jgi:hypothetical protein
MKALLLEQATLTKELDSLEADWLAGQDELEALV